MPEAGGVLCRRNIKERLEKELERNLALRVEPGETADCFIVSGRGALHISILVENMRCVVLDSAVLHYP